MPVRVYNATHAAVVLQRYQQVQNEPEKEATVHALNELFPNIRFRHHRKTGLTVYFLETKVTKLPRSIEQAAGMILKVRADGKAEITKNKTGPVGAIVPAMERLVELGGKVPEAARRSRWELLLDDDWLF